MRIKAGVLLWFYVPLYSACHTITSLGRWFNLCPSSEPSGKWIQFLCPVSVIRFGRCLQSTLRSLIGDILHSVHLQAVPSRTQAKVLLGDESPGVFQGQSFFTPTNPVLTLCEATCSQISKFSYFSHVPHPPNTKMSHLVMLGLSCWCWSRGCSSFQGAKQCPELGMAVVCPQWWQRWVVAVPPSGCGFLVFGCFCLTPSAARVHLCGCSIIAYKLANRKKIFQLIWNKSDILFFTSGEIFNYNNVALSFWQMLMNCCLHVWFTA